MLIDKTQLLNRLQQSGCTFKTNSFSNHIKSPYVEQYRIFQERLKNPKIKTSSMIIRKIKNQQHQGKYNLHSQSQQFLQHQCLKQAKKFLNKDQNLILFPTHNTIDYDVSEFSKQSEVILKFKEKLFDLKLNKKDQLHNQKNRISTATIAAQKYQKSQLGSFIRSERQTNRMMKPYTAQIFNVPQNRKSFRENQNPRKNLQEKKLPLTFLTYKRNKSIAQRLTKDKK